MEQEPTIRMFKPEQEAIGQEYQEEKDEAEEEKDMLERRSRLSRREGDGKSGSENVSQGYSAINSDGNGQKEHEGSHRSSIYLDKDLVPMGLVFDSIPAAIESCVDEMFDVQKKKFDGQIGKRTDVHAVEELDPEIINDFDVEEVLSKQETHDLYCPNCKSRITRKVILKKRKRKGHPLSDELEPERPDNAVQPAGPDANPIPPQEPEEEPDIFRCLSCFRFLIPIRSGSNLFGGSNLPDSPASTDTGIPNWWLSCFLPDKKKPGQPQGDAKPSQSQAQTTPPAEGNEPPTLPISDGAFPGKEPGNDKTADAKVTSGSEPTEHEGSEAIPSEVKPPYKNGTPGVGIDTQPHSSIYPVPLPGKLEIPGKGKPADEVHVIIHGEPDERPDLVPDVGSTDPPASVDETQDIEARSGPGVEILKSIVYGGLAESITSLSIVSSAAGSGASTLNILALGLANLVSGLIVIAHNLRDLKNENTGLPNESRARYRELLGRKENFKLHAFIVILSYLIFGLIPPLVYAFSFRESDNEDYKLASVFLASLICIILLAIGKVHVQSPQKSYVKTVMYYASIGISSSGISFVVGDLLGEFLKKLGWFESKPSAMLSMLEGKLLQPGLAAF